MAAIDHGGFAKILKYLPRHRTVKYRNNKEQYHISTTYFELENERMARQWDEQERWNVQEALKAVITPVEDSFDAYEEETKSEAAPKKASKAARANSAKHWYIWKKR
jgi:DNA-dependent RNA polymerase auxiliary subunit epsilon